MINWYHSYKTISIGQCSSPSTPVTTSHAFTQLWKLLFTKKYSSRFPMFAIRERFCFGHQVNFWSLGLICRNESIQFFARNASKVVLSYSYSGSRDFPVSVKSMSS